MKKLPLLIALFFSVFVNACQQLPGQEGNCTNQTNQTNLTAPTALEAYWSSGGNGWPPRWIYAHGIKFTFDGGISGVQSFKLYERKPGEASFSLATAFNGPSLIEASCSGSIRSGLWSLYYHCPPEAGFPHWIASIDGQSSSYFPVGQYDFYLTSVDISGLESRQSSILTQYAVHRTTILSPIGPAPQVPLFRWTVAGNWPSYPAPYKIRVADNSVPGFFPYDPQVVYASAPAGSKVYDGEPLSTEHNYTAYIDGSNIINGIYYISMMANSTVFWIRNQTNETPSNASRICYNGNECGPGDYCLSSPLDNSFGICTYYPGDTSVSYPQCDDSYYPALPCQCGNVPMHAGACNHGIFYWPPILPGNSIGTPCTDDRQCSTPVCFLGFCSYSVQCTPQSPGYCYSESECSNAGGNWCQPGRCTSGPC